jgi:hypothetical protein
MTIFLFLTLSVFLCCLSACTGTAVNAPADFSGEEFSFNDPSGVIRSENDSVSQVEIKELKDGRIEFTASGSGASLLSESPELARRRAEEDALSRAAGKTGVNVQSGMFDISSGAGFSSQILSSYVNVWSSAFSSYELSGEPVCRLTGNGTVCRVKIKGYMYSRGEPDPDFRIMKAELGQPGYFEDDSISISLKVSRDCYITVLNVDEKGNVTVVFPNGYAVDGFVKAGKPVVIPDDYNFDLRTELPAGRAETAEMLHIIATKNAPFLPAAVTGVNAENPFVAYPAGSINNIALRLTEFRRSDWTTAVLPYSISSKKGQARLP